MKDAIAATNTGDADAEARSAPRQAGAPLATGSASTARAVAIGPRHSISGPSSLYRAELWRVGVFMARRLPHFVLGRTASNLAKLYWLSCARRRRVVFENLLPAMHSDRLAARVATRELFQQFALKLADLWRYESGLSIYNLFGELTGW